MANRDPGRFGLIAWAFRNKAAKKTTQMTAAEKILFICDLRTEGGLIRSICI